ncbi:unnamed protein product [Lymnaea stagnalis]|uniref:Uncharacterized protein n=1 Tax=Lymnaea stagnalis TaxID=6523 RepID=A0AAV2IH64_LYMST
MFLLLFNLGLRVSLVITEDRTSPCSFHCAGNETCDNKIGECTHGCQDGWTGLTCTKLCPINCYKDACDWKTQQCVRGCNPGFTGTFCDKSEYRSYFVVHC